MKLYLKFDSSLAFKKIIQEQLEKLQINFSQTGMNELEVGDSVSGETIREISASLSEYGIEIIETQKSVLVQRIKDTIFEMVNRD